MIDVKKVALVILTFFSIFLVACTSTSQAPPANEIATGDNANWRSIPLNDIRTGETFTIDQFAGKPILLESFAVWCPTCTKQQQEIRKLHRDVGDTVISISLDTDPNEDEAKVLEHIEAHDFDWLYAVAPTPLIQSLIDDFSIGVVNAPAAPVVLVCPDQSARFLQRGVKSPDDLQREIERGC